MDWKVLRNITSSDFLVLLLQILRLFAVVNDDTRQLFNSSSVVYRHDRNVIDDDDPSFVILPKSGFASQQTLRFQAERSSNGSYTCEPRGFGESDAAIVYVVTNKPTIEIEGPRKRVVYEDSDLNLLAFVRYEADTVYLWAVQDETKRVISCSERKERIFSNATVALKLCRLSRFDEGRIFVKGKGLLLPTRSTFESRPIDVEIIRRPSSVAFTKEVGRDGWVELAWENTPTDPNHRYDPPIYYRVEWGLSMTATRFQPNISIDARNLSVSEVNVSVVAVGNYTESRVNSTRIPTGLTIENSTLLTSEIPTSETPTPLFTSEMPSNKSEENATVADTIAGEKGLSAGEIVGIVLGVLGGAVALIIATVLVYKKYNSNSRKTGDGQPVNSVKLNDTAASDDREGSSNGVVAETTAENGQQGSSRTEMEHVANADVASSENATEPPPVASSENANAITAPSVAVPGLDDGSVRPNSDRSRMELMDMIEEHESEQAKAREAFNAALRKKAEKEVVEKLEKDMKKQAKIISVLQKQLQEHLKNSRVSQATRVDDCNSGSDSEAEEVVALYNTCFGDHEKELIRKLNALTPTSTFLSDLAVENLIPSDHKLKEDSEKLGDWLLGHLRQTVKRKRDVANIKRLFEKHYPGEDLLQWITDPT